MRNASYDHIILGAGAAGCVLARRLIDAGRRVLLVESGPLRRRHSNVDSVGGFTNLWNSALDWALTTVPQVGLANRQITINQGRLVGGSSAINAMMYVRCHSGDYHNLQQRCGSLWNAERIQSSFAKLENYIDGPSDFRYQSGLMSVRNCPDPRSYSAVFQRAAVELGYHGDDWDYNGPVQENGAGPLQFNISVDGRRHSAFNAYLEPILSNPLLTLFSDCSAHHLLYRDNRHVTGVSLLNDRGESIDVYCDHDVVVACGALQSPQLLLRSGLGPASALTAAGIPVRADLPMVGQQLQDHLQLPIIYALTKPLPEPEILTGNVLFLNLNNNSLHGAPDLQLNFTPASPQPLQQFLPPLGGPVMIFLPILVQPRSQGEVRIHPDQHCSIDPGYLSDPSDLTVLDKAIQVVRSMVATSAMQDLVTSELLPADQNSEQFIRSNASTLWHPVGTCAMGRDTQNSVVDAHLRVHGIHGLRVVDASVIPRATAGNTHVPTMIVAENAASLMIEGH